MPSPCSAFRALNVCLLMWSCALGLSLPCCAQEATDSQTLLPIKQKVLQGLRHSKLEDRVAAIKSLATSPGVEATKLLIPKGLASSEAELRKAAYETLLLGKNDRTITNYLCELVAADLKKESVTDQTAVVLRLLLAAELPDLQIAVEETLEQAAASPDSARQLLIRLTELLVQEDNAASFQLLVRLTSGKLFLQDFAVRRAVVQSLIKFRTNESITQQIAILERATGEVRADILRQLASISGKKYGSHSEWRQWWNENEAMFAFPPVPAKSMVLQDTATLFKDTSSYYDMPLTATRVVFVIDSSGSMRGLRIVRAQQELSKAIGALQSNTFFNVLSFDGSVDRWQSKLVEANTKNKQLAQKFVEKLQLGRSTASYDALKAALKFDMESIYFLTDGMPRGGKIEEPAEIVKAIVSENRFRRVTFNSIGVGVDSPGSLFDSFLRTLATENFGDYRRIDE